MSGMMQDGQDHYSDITDDDVDDLEVVCVNGDDVDTMVDVATTDSGDIRNVVRGHGSDNSVDTTHIKKEMFHKVNNVDIATSDDNVDNSDNDGGHGTDNDNDNADSDDGKSRDIDPIYANLIINDELEVGYVPSRYSYKLRKNTEPFYVLLPDNAMATFAFQATPFVRMYEMGLIDTMGHQTAKIHLGSDCWFEVYGPFRSCIIKDPSHFLLFSYETMVEMHQYFFTGATFQNRIGQISQHTLPCTYTHPTLVHFSRCTVCNNWS